MKKTMIVLLGILLVASIGFVIAEDVCDSEHLSLCTGQNECEDVGGYWYNATCNEEEEEFCGTSTLGSCESDDDCMQSGPFSEICQSTFEPPDTTLGGPYLECADYQEYGKECGCVENQCQWRDKAEGENGGIVTMNKTRIDRTNLTFVPWQKRNESECLEGCFCRGAVMTCTVDGVKTMTIEAGRSGNIITITFDGTETNTELEVEVDSNGKNDTDVYVKLGNGRKAQIKVMPDTATERALERLKLRACSEENECTIELKEVGRKEEISHQLRLVYEIQAERHFRILAMFKVKAEVKAQVDAETGELIRVKKPWWAFLATEPEE